MIALAFSSRRVQLVIAASAIAACAGFVNGQQFRLQKTNSISLSAHFFNSATTTTGSDFGTNPLSIGFDGTSAFVGGYHSDIGTLASNKVGIVRVDGVLGTSPVAVPLAPTSFTTPNFRGIDSVDTFGGDAFYLHDSGAPATTLVSRITPAGSAVWTLTGAPDNQRIGAMTIDPRGNAGQPLVAFLARSSGRVQGLDVATGSVLLGPTGGTAPALGPVITANPTIGFTPRGMTFDTNGNIGWATGTGMAYGVRAGDAQYQQLNGSAGTTGSILKTNLSVNSDNVGNGIAIAEKLNGGTASLLALAGRVGGDATIGFSSTYTASTGQVQPIDSRNVYLRNLDGTDTDLVQPLLRGDEDGIGTAYNGETKNFAYALDAAGNPVLLVLSFADRRLDVYQLEPTYTATGPGTWADPANWRVGLVPNSALLNARFGEESTARFPAVNGAHTTKHLKFDTNSGGYVLTGTGSITIDAPAGVRGQISALNGSHTVGVPVILAKDTDLNTPNAGDGLSFTTDFNGGAFAVAKRGPGMVNMTAIRSGALNIAEGTVNLAFSNAVSRTGTLSIANNAGVYTAALNIVNEQLVISSTPVAEVTAAIVSGRAGGNWSGLGIQSGAAASAPATNALGVAVAGDIGISNFLGEPVLGTDVLVRYTRLGDANLDGTTNISDFSRLASNFNNPGVWSTGDFNYDGTTNITDFSGLAANFNQSVARGSVVPEPASLAAFAVIGLMCATRKRR